MNKGRLWAGGAVLAATLLGAAPVIAAEYTLPEDGSRLVGSVSYATVQEGQTLLDIARAHGIGYRAIRLANPGLDPWVPQPGSRVLLPTSYILPDTPREGIVLNLAEMRLYYYPPAEKGSAETVVTYPVSIGRRGWGTPEGLTEVVAKAEKPTWRPPESIRKEAEEAGDPLPETVPPGPENPLGDYAINLGLPGYLFHGTNKPFGIGMRVSHGCVRLYPKHIERLYHQVERDTPVRIVDRPYKVARIGDQIFMESHIPPIGEGKVWNGQEAEGQDERAEGDDIQREGLNYTPLVSNLTEISRGRPELRVDLPGALQSAQGTRGIPVPVPLAEPLEEGSEPVADEEVVADEKEPPAESSTGGSQAG